MPFKAKKTLKDGTLTADQYTFTLTETDSTWKAKSGGVSESVSNTAPAGENTFGEVTFTDVILTEEGVRYFIIEEVIPTGQEADGTIIYDTHKQKITVSVTDDEGVLTAAKTYDPEYNEEGYDASFTNQKLGSVQVTKTFSGIEASQIPDDFQITASWSTKDVPTNTRALTVSGDVTDADVTRVGSDLSYTWTISNLPIGTEVTFRESGLDISGYSVTSIVTDSEHDGTDGIEGQASAAVEPGTVAFENNYVTGTELPSTGGSGTLAYTIGGLALALLAGVLLISRKKRRNNRSDSLSGRLRKQPPFSENMRQRRRREAGGTIGEG